MNEKRDACIYTQTHWDREQEREHWKKKKTEQKNIKAWSMNYVEYGYGRAENL